jgi:hypothetical protein
MADIYKKRRAVFIILTILLFSIGLMASLKNNNFSNANSFKAERNTEVAINTLQKLKINNVKSPIEYQRDYFGKTWGEINGCSTREVILFRDLENSVVKDDCTVQSGSLLDPYTGKIIQFIRGKDTSSKVQIDHVVALSDAWKKGAYLMDEKTRLEFANDPLELLAVDGGENIKKSDSDASRWLPKNIGYRCEYVARQIAVKFKYSIWVDTDEMLAMKSSLAKCPDQRLPAK